MATKTIYISDLKINTNIGILDYEINKSQIIIINAKFNLEYVNTTNIDDIECVLDYRKLRNIIIEESTDTHINLIETLINRIINKITTNLPEVLSLQIKIEKPMAFSDCLIGMEVFYP
ncbi:dihydroneopterin aldolase [Candidatus Kinetoplastibacterium desouzaii TCC079E]|uniref:dihydroneopterin aldolase n=1 Tax=Candidatus Kinetoplastidibacterium desouzai TCC079E TaxID=1208919 RepID=M1LLH3_9PROT|nr:dihydroneopterin aldolase [Candidatus Kinetoplastibacterium desouzaii]AGF46607.1 dihydroneopterin aldolase [Candidatus Kinetoplastibacterium desouzaii TCC079E]